MSGNRSLDEFAGAEPDDTVPADESTAETVEPAVEDGPDDDATSHESDLPSPDDDPNPPDAGAVDRPASTYAWSPDGASCDACGATVEERWRDGDDLVCAGCKEW